MSVFALHSFIIRAKIPWWYWSNWI